MKTKIVTKPAVLVRPQEFKFFSSMPSAQPYIAYLHKRGFSDLDIHTAKDCGIMYATRGDYKGRIMFLVYHEKELVGWTGRTIYDVVDLRYKTLSTDPEKEEFPAPHPITDYLLFYDILMRSKADTIVLCEGPFDAWRVNVLGKNIGVVATCFFTSSLTFAQLSLLHSLLPRFKRRVLLLDRNTFAKSQTIKSELASLDVEACVLQDFKDPGEIKYPKQLQNLLAIV